MSTITTAQFSKLLWPGLKAAFGKEYAKYPEQYSQVFDKQTSDKAYEEYLSLSGFGLAKATPQGSPVSYDTEQQGYLQRIQHVTYQLGFIVTKEMLEDDLYNKVAPQRARELAWSMQETREVIGANILNNAFNPAVTYADGKSMVSSARPFVAGGTWSNIIAVAADLSEAALEQATIDIMKFTDDRGKRISVKPRKLIISPEQWAEADRILKSDNRPGTNNNDINAIMKSGRIPEVFVMQRLTDPDAWFIKTDVPTPGLIYLSRVEDSFSEDNDFETDNLKYKARARYSFGMGDPRIIYGSPGA